MSRFTQKVLMRDIVYGAIGDRREYLNAVSGASKDDFAEATHELEMVCGLRGKTLRRALNDSPEALFLACVCAEIWYEGLATGGTDEIRRDAAKSYKAIKEFRHAYLGKSRLEIMLERAGSVSLDDVR